MPSSRGRPRRARPRNRPARRGRGGDGHRPDARRGRRDRARWPRVGAVAAEQAERVAALGHGRASARPMPRVAPTISRHQSRASVGPPLVAELGRRPDHAGPPNSRTDWAERKRAFGVPASRTRRHSGSRGVMRAKSSARVTASLARYTRPPARNHHRVQRVDQGLGGGARDTAGRARASCPPWETTGSAPLRAAVLDHREERRGPRRRPARLEEPARPRARRAGQHALVLEEAAPAVQPVPVADGVERVEEPSQETSRRRRAPAVRR